MTVGGRYGVSREDPAPGYPPPHQVWGKLRGYDEWEVLGITEGLRFFAVLRMTVVRRFVRGYARVSADGSPLLTPGCPSSRA